MKASDKKPKYQTIIKPNNNLTEMNLGELFHYKDLVCLFVKRDFTVLYKQTVLGPLWAIIQPLLTTIVFTVIFGNMAKLTTADLPGDFILPGFIFYMAGNICWSYFSSTVEATSNTFIRNRHIMGKVYFPRVVAPISTACSHLIAFAIQFVLLLGIILYFVLQGDTSIQASGFLFLLPFVILQLIMLALGCGLIISSVTTKYRDLAMLVGFGLQLWQYGSPIAYGLELIPSRYRAIYMLNPVTPIITTFRYVMFGFGYFDWRYYLISWCVTLAIFGIGLVLFSRIERTFMDTI